MSIQRRIFIALLTVAALSAVLPCIGNAAEMALFSKQYTVDGSKKVTISDRIMVPSHIDTLRFSLRASDPELKDITISFNGETLRLGPGESVEVASPSSAAARKDIGKAMRERKNKGKHARPPGRPINEIEVTLQGKEAAYALLTVSGIFDPAKAPTPSEE